MALSSHFLFAATAFLPRRYDRFNARVKEAGGLAAERAWSRAGRPNGTAGESHRERRSRVRVAAALGRSRCASWFDEAAGYRVTHIKTSHAKEHI